MRASNIVSRTVDSSRLSLSSPLTRLIVSSTGSALRCVVSHWIGIRISLAATKALRVSRTSDGGRSKSVVDRVVSQIRRSALCSRFSRRPSRPVRPRRPRGQRRGEHSELAPREIENKLSIDSPSRSASYVPLTPALWSTPSAVEALPCGSMSMTRHEGPAEPQSGGDVDRRGGPADAALLVRGGGGAVSGGAEEDR